MKRIDGKRVRWEDMQSSITGDSHFVYVQPTGNRVQKRQPQQQRYHRDCRRPMPQSRLDMGEVGHGQQCCHHNQHRDQPCPQLPAIDPGGIDKCITEREGDKHACQPNDNLHFVGIIGAYRFSPDCACSLRPGLNGGNESVPCKLLPAHNPPCRAQHDCQNQ